MGNLRRRQAGISGIHLINPNRNDVQSCYENEVYLSMEIWYKRTVLLDIILGILIAESSGSRKIRFSIKRNNKRVHADLLKPERRDLMKYFLTSAGIKNNSILDTLVEFPGKPINESSILYIPTASSAMPCGTGMAANQ